MTDLNCIITVWTSLTKQALSLWKVDTRHFHWNYNI